MSPSAHKAAVNTLLSNHPQPLWRGLNNQRTPGVAAHWPDLEPLVGDWPRGAITEVVSALDGIGELRLVLPAVAELSQREARWVLWVAPPHIPYPAALAAAGVDLSRMLVLHPRKDQDTLWALELALRSGSCSAVLAWPPALQDTQWRRLQLAAEAGNSLAFFFFRQGSAATVPVALRLELHPARQEVDVDVRKRRGAIPARGMVALSDQLALAL